MDTQPQEAIRKVSSANLSPTLPKLHSILGFVRKVLEKGASFTDRLMEMTARMNRQNDLSLVNITPTRAPPHQPRLSTTPLKPSQPTLTTPQLSPLSTHPTSPPHPPPIPTHAPFIPPNFNGRQQHPTHQPQEFFHSHIRPRILTKDHPTGTQFLVAPGRGGYVNVGELLRRMSERKEQKRVLSRLKVSREMFTKVGMGVVDTGVEGKSLEEVFRGKEQERAEKVKNIVQAKKIVQTKATCPLEDSPTSKVPQPIKQKVETIKGSITENPVQKSVDNRRNSSQMVDRGNNSTILETSNELDSSAEQQVKGETDVRKEVEEKVIDSKNNDKKADNQLSPTPAATASPTTPSPHNPSQPQISPTLTPTTTPTPSSPTPPLKRINPFLAAISPPPSSLALKPTDQQLQNGFNHNAIATSVVDDMRRRLFGGSGSGGNTSNNSSIDGNNNSGNNGNNNGNNNWITQPQPMPIIQPQSTTQPQFHSLAQKPHQPASHQTNSSLFTSQVPQPTKTLFPASPPSLVLFPPPPSQSPHLNQMSSILARNYQPPTQQQPPIPTPRQLPSFMQPSGSIIPGLQGSMPRTILERKPSQFAPYPPLASLPHIHPYPSSQHQFPPPSYPNPPSFTCPQKNRLILNSFLTPSQFKPSPNPNHPSNNTSPSLFSNKTVIDVDSEEDWDRRTERRQNKGNLYGGKKREKKEDRIRG